MTATYTEAVDAINGAFYEAWQAEAASIVGSVPEIRWQGVEADKPPQNVFWCRVSIQTVYEEQTTLSNDNGTKRYRTGGLVFVQIFCPTADAQAMDKGRKLAIVARNAFRGKQTANGVWFRNARINELPPEDDAYRLNVVADYEYDDIG